ncbi:hypothetical protein [Mesobacillus selenatarsenatis]|uniref:Uncharacterized protein n=1 Tax=Mesobacillus selenatarsenatis TaxID=388741 RepID=A0A846U0J1_9BACI|nr:hypothetical protein [Mesobacillus selenatarsenatis]NKE07356.1 hypothetical protein [Mesobacillus selenatarsenatis]
MSELAPTSDKFSPGLPHFVRTCPYFRQILVGASPFCLNLHLLQTKPRLGFPFLSELAPTSDKFSPGLPHFVRTCPYFRQILAGASPFCLNLHLLQTKSHLSFLILSEPAPTSDKITPELSHFVRTCTYFRQILAGASPFCLDLHLLQAKPRLGFPFLSELAPTSDKITPELSHFIRTCTYFRQILAGASPFCPNLHPLKQIALLTLILTSPK